MPAKKTTTTPKVKAKSSTRSSGKTTVTTPKKRKQLLNQKKKLSIEELHPFPGFPYRLEYQDGTDQRFCHFQCEEHRDKHIKRYKLRKGSYFIDNLT